MMSFDRMVNVRVAMRHGLIRRDERVKWETMRRVNAGCNATTLDVLVYRGVRF